MEQVEKSDFDIWFEKLCKYAFEKEGRAPYKMQWLEFFEKGIDAETAFDLYAKDNQM